MKAILLLALVAFVVAQDPCKGKTAEKCHSAGACGWADSKCVECKSLTTQSTCAAAAGCGYFFEKEGDKCKSCSSILDAPFGECHRFIGCTPVSDATIAGQKPEKKYSGCTDVLYDDEARCEAITAEGICLMVSGCKWTGTKCKLTPVCADFTYDLCPGHCLKEGTTCRDCLVETDKAKCETEGSQCKWCANETTKCHYAACPVEIPACSTFDTVATCVVAAAQCGWKGEAADGTCVPQAEIEPYCNAKTAEPECTALKYALPGNTQPVKCNFCATASSNKCSTISTCDCSRIDIASCNTAKLTAEATTADCIVDLTNRNCVKRTDVTKPDCIKRYPDLCTNAQTTLTEAAEDCAFCEINGYCAKKTDDVCWEACEKFPANTAKTKCETATDRETAVHCKSCDFDGTCVDKLTGVCVINCDGAAQDKCSSEAAKDTCLWCAFGYCDAKGATCETKCDGLAKEKCADPKLADLCQWCDLNGYCAKKADTCKVDCDKLTDETACKANTSMKCKWDATATTPGCKKSGAARIALSFVAVVVAFAVALF